MVDKAYALETPDRLDGQQFLLLGLGGMRPTRQARSFCGSYWSTDCRSSIMIDGYNRPTEYLPKLCRCSRLGFSRKSRILEPHMTNQLRASQVKIDASSNCHDQEGFALSKPK